ATALAEAAQELGGCSVLVNNAGMSMRGAFPEISAEVFSRVCETNITGSALATQALLPALQRHGGSVIFVSSVAGMTGFPGVSIYAAAKMALSGLAESLRGELHGSGVHVGVIHPGFTENDADKRILAADGSPLSLTRPYDMTQVAVARHIVRMVERRTERKVLTRKGQLLRIVQRLSPRLTSAIIRRSAGNIHGAASLR
ncbi:MAG: SDR family NAD(P)-dependent oxidoreductase, partial [Spirochaetia bacterium]